MKVCPKCKAEFDWGAKACPKCGKRLANAEVKLKLECGGKPAVTISCKERIRLSVLETVAAYRFDLPPLNIKPFSAKDLGICLGLFALIFVGAAFFSVSEGLGCVLVIAMAAVNLVYTRNFYASKIKKLLAQGYGPADDDTRQVLQNAGLLAK